MRPTCGVWHRMVPSLAVWYPALVKLRSLVPENLHVRISDLVFLRSRGTKLRFLAEFGGAKPPILEEGRCHIADLVRERWIPVHRAVGLWLRSPCRRRQMDRRGRRAALPRGRVRCGSALCGAVGDRRARRDPQGGVARLRRLRVLAWAYLLHRRCRKAAAEDRSQTFENVNE